MSKLVSDFLIQRIGEWHISRIAEGYIPAWSKGPAPEDKPPADSAIGGLQAYFA